jgi:hypothetical protein
LHCSSQAFKIRVRLNREALSIHYPEFGKLLEKWREIVKFKAHIFDKLDQLMGMVELDSINNLLIPSNVQKIMNSFFQTLAMGNDGNGSMIRIFSFPEQASKQSFLLNTDAEVLANGTLKLGFNLQRKFFALPPEFLVEIRTFKKQLWNALYHDFQRIKTQRGYQ